MSEKLCDGNCNECPIITHPNSRVLTQIFNTAELKLGDEFYPIVQNICPNLTVCYDCRIDDFCHTEGCKIMEKVVKANNMNIKTKFDQGQEVWVADWHTDDSIKCKECGTTKHGHKKWKPVFMGKILDTSITLKKDANTAPWITYTTEEEPLHFMREKDYYLTKGEAQAVCDEKNKEEMAKRSAE